MSVRERCLNVCIHINCTCITVTLTQAFGKGRSLELAQGQYDVLVDLMPQHTIKPRKPTLVFSQSKIIFTHSKIRAS